jgi:hypothetical protein
VLSWESFNVAFELAAMYLSQKGWDKKSDDGEDRKT